MIRGLGEKDPSRIGDWMQTFTGNRFFPQDPRPEEIHIKDIAHSLSQQCRFAGHTTSFYSVAQHSVYVSYQVPPEWALWGLLHDASEAYLVDVPRPVKYRLTGYEQMERDVMQAVCIRFGLLEYPVWEGGLPAPVREADERMLATEAREFMRDPQNWTDLAEPYDFRLRSWTSIEAEIDFLERFKNLTEGKLT